MSRCIVKMQSEGTVSLAIKSPLPKNGAFPPHTILESLHHFYPEICCHCHPWRHKFQMHDAQCVKEKNGHCFPGRSGSQCFLRTEGTFLQPLTGTLFGLWLEEGEPRFICGDHFFKKGVILLELSQILSAKLHSVVLLLLCQEAWHKFRTDFGHSHVFLEQSVDTGS